VFDSGDLRVAMKYGDTWTFNPDCCTLLSDQPAAAAAADAAAIGVDGNGDGFVDESSSDDEEEDSIQIAGKFSFQQHRVSNK